MQNPLGQYWIQYVSAVVSAYTAELQSEVFRRNESHQGCKLTCSSCLHIGLFPIQTLRQNQEDPSNLSVKLC